jgi:hypothetical protein
MGLLQQALAQAPRSDPAQVSLRGRGWRYVAGADLELPARSIVLPSAALDSFRELKDLSGLAVLGPLACVRVEDCQRGVSARGGGRTARAPSASSGSSCRFRFTRRMVYESPPGTACADMAIGCSLNRWYWTCARAAWTQRAGAPEKARTGAQLPTSCSEGTIGTARPRRSAAFSVRTFYVEPSCVRIRMGPRPVAYFFLLA